MPCINHGRRADSSLHREGGSDDDGFTLIELLVVLLIIGILLAIAIPVFLSVTKNANNVTAQDNLQTALTGAKVYYTDGGQTYKGVTTASGTTSDIQQIATGLSFTTANPSASPHVVSVFWGPSGAYIVLTAFSLGTNDCWGVVDITSDQQNAVQGSKSPGTSFFVERNQTASCAASNYAPSADGGGGVTASQTSSTGFPSG